MLEPVQETPADATPPENSGLPRVTLMGVGKGGIAIISKIRLPDVPLHYIAADTSCSDLDAVTIPACTKIQLGPKALRGFGAGLQAKSGEKAARESEKKIAEALAGTDLLLLVTALGHGTGSGASPVIAKIAQDAGIPVVCFATNPFSEEGKHFTEQAAAAAEKLSELSNAFVLIDNEVVAQITDGTQEFDAVFKTGVYWIERSIVVCCSMIFSAQTETRLDFSVFKSIFPVPGTRTLFAVGSASGENAFQNALEDLFNCPFLQSASAAARADTLAIRVCAGHAPSLQEMEAVSKGVRERFGGEERTISNFAVLPDLEDTIEICVLGADDIRATRRRRERTVAAPQKGQSVLAPQFSQTDEDEEDELPLIDTGNSLFASGKKQLYEGIDLDTPTFRRKRIKLQEELDARRKRVSRS